MNKYAKLLLPGLFFSSLAGAQIPTTDILGIATETVNHLATIQQWKGQYDQMRSQIDGIKKQYDTVTGSRGLGAILNDPAFRNHLPDDWVDVYNSVSSGGYQGLSGPARDIYDNNTVFDMCSSIADVPERVNCESKGAKGSQDKAFALAAYESASDRIDQINDLMTSIDATQDPKGIAELQARIATEQALIQNEATKLALFQVVSQAEEQLRQQREAEIEARKMARRDVYEDYAPVNLLNP